MINIDELMEIANQKLVERKKAKNPFIAPEFLPDGIASDQVKALAEAMQELVNEELNEIDNNLLQIVSNQLIISKKLVMLMSQ